MLIPYEPDLGRDAINDTINEAIKSRHGVKKVELVKIIGKNSSMGSDPMEAHCIPEGIPKMNDFFTMGSDPIVFE